MHFYTFILTYKCNNGCIFCSRPTDEKAFNVWGREQELSTAEVFSKLEKLREKYEGVIFTGGEPALRKDFIEILQKCVELDFKKISVQTNGIKFSNESFAEEVCSILGKRADIFVSFHAHNAKLFTALCRTNMFERVLSGLKNLLTYCEEVRTNTVVMKPNYRFLPDIAKFICNQGVSHLEFMAVHPNGYAWLNRDTIVPRIEDTIPFLKKAIDIVTSFGRRVTLNRFPLCILGEYARYASELFLPKHMVAESDKICYKNGSCKKCKYYYNCPGIWHTYSQIYDFKFKPIFR